MDETIQWFFILKTACRALRTVEFRCVVPPPVFVVPLRYDEPMSLTSDEAVKSVKMHVRHFKLHAMNHSDGFHKAYYEESRD